MQEKPNSQSTEGIGPVYYDLADRSLEDQPIIELPSLESTTRLMDSWVGLQKSKPKTQLQTPEWQFLEKSYMKHLEWRFDYPKQVLQQQLIFAWIITLLIVALIMSGIVFSFVQLIKAMEITDFTSLSTEVQWQEATGYSFRSSVVGATVLVISLLFFYLYLRYVFSVKSPRPPHITLADNDILKISGRRGGRRRTESAKKGEAKTSDQA